MATNTAALQSMAAWIAAIADNIMNPIAGIGAALTIADQQLERRRTMDDWDPATLEQSLAMMRTRLGTLSEYVGELIDFAKPAALSCTRLDARRELTSACNAIDAPDRYGVEFTVEIAPGTPPLFADGPKLERALKALVINALEAVGGVSAPLVRVFAQPGAAAASVEVGVEDNGHGMSDATRARATEPFYSTKEAGTGLGLTLAEKCVKGHGGQLAIGRSTDLGGCRVTLTFPPAHEPAHASRETPR